MMRTTVLLLTALVVVGSVPTAATAQSTADVTLTISAVDRNGDAVSGATVTATWDGGNATETTRANGQTLIDVPQGAAVEIDVTSDDYIRNTPYEIESASGGNVEIEVAQKGSATIEVTDKQGNAVSDAIVRLWQDGSRIVNARTDGDGVHETDAIEQAEYNLFVFKEGFRKNSTMLQVDGDVSGTYSIEQGSTTVTFSVTDDHFSPAASVENASIDVAGVASNIKTLGSGENTLSVPVNDDYEVTVSKQGYETTTERLSVGEEPTSLNATIRRTPAISIDSLADRVVVGENVSIDVTDEYGTPVGNASVTLDGEAVGTTDANGELTFSIGTQGEHTLTATSEGLEATATIQGISPTTEQAATESQATDSNGETTQSSGGGPGFTPLAALVAALLGVLFLARD